MRSGVLHQVTHGLYFQPHVYAAVKLLAVLAVLVTAAVLVVQGSRRESDRTQVKVSELFRRDVERVERAIVTGRRK